MKEEGEPFWLTRARQEVGQSEAPGPSSNPRIVEYHACTKLQATDDTIPWCSSFMCWVFEQEGIPSTKSAAAISWLDWGESISKPVLGCVVVLRRPSGGPSAAHVGFYVGEYPGVIELLGGNQANRVCIQPYPLELVLGYRVPDPRYAWNQEKINRSLDS